MKNKDMVMEICGYLFRKMKWSAGQLPAMLVLLLALSASGTASGADWAANYGTLTGANALTTATAVDASGNVYLAGYFDGTTFTLGSVTLTRIGTQDAFVAKLDASGAILWAKNFGGSGAYTTGQSIAVDGSGNVYLGGEFNANLTTPALTKIGGMDAFALKLDSTGAFIWAKSFGGSGAYAYSKGIAVDGSGNVYLEGQFANANLTTPALTRIGTQDAFAIKLDSTGSTTWAKNFGGSGATVYGSRSIAVDGSGNVYLGGYFQIANLTTPVLTKIGTSDAFAIKLDSTGATTWAKNFGGSGAYAYGQSIAVDGSGNVYLGGYFQSANLTTPALTKIGTADTFAIKLDSTGATTWAKNFGGNGASANATNSAVDNSGNVYLVGFIMGANLTTPALTKIGIGGYDTFAIKLDSTGATTWAKNFGGSGATAFGYGIGVDGSGNVYMAGCFLNANLTTPALTKIGAQDTFAIKLDSTGAFTWAKNVGTFTTGYASVNATTRDATGNVYLAGYFDGATFTLGSVTLTRIGTRDAFVAKLDASGTVLWAKNFSGSGVYAVGQGIAVDSTGNVYLGGYFNNANLTTPALTKIGTYDVFALKLDSTGATTWAKNFGGSGAYAYGYGIAVDGSGNVYLGGYIYNANLTTPALTKIGNNDAFAIKLSSTGATTWAKNFGGSGANAYGQSIAVDGTGNVYLGGYFLSNNLTSPALTLIGTGASDAFAIKIDSSGGTTWAKNFGGSGAFTYSNGIAADGSGNVYLGGYFQYANLTTPALTMIGSRDLLAVKLDSSGAVTWARNFGGSGAYAYGYSIAVDGSGNVYLGGNFSVANLTTPALTKIGTNDAFALKLDSFGATTWAKNIGGSGANTYGQSIAVNETGNVYLGGSFQTANLTTPALTKIGNTDAFIIDTQLYTLTYAISVNGSISGASPQTVSYGDSGSAVTAVPNANYYFVNWTGTNGFVTTTSNPLTVTNVSSNMTITANFALDVPVAAFSATPNPAACGQTISFSGTASYHTNPSRTIVSYEWDFTNDGTYDGTGSINSHAYPAFGTYTAKLRVTDDNAKTSTTTVAVSVNQGNMPPIANAGGPYMASVGATKILDGSASSDSNMACGDTIVSYSWNIGNGALIITGVNPSLSSAQTTALGSGTFPIILTVTDTFGATGTSTTSLMLDGTAPTTTASATGYTFGNWTSTGTINVTLSASDGSGSGVAAGHPKYCVDTTNTCTPDTNGTSVSVTCASGTACTQYVRYQSVDNAGNMETVRSAIVRQDLRPIRPGDLPQTGQTTVYSAGDDGNLQTGAAWPSPRFTPTSAGTGTVVADNLTGLIWSQDGATPTVGPCTGGAMTWQGALDYVACLNTIGYLGYTDWRLPNVNELKSLENNGQSSPATWLNTQGFINAQAYYWSSTTYAYDTSGAWVVGMLNGAVSYGNKTYNYYVWPVRGGQCGSSGNSNICLPKTGQTTVYSTGDDGSLQTGLAWPSPRFTVLSSGTDTVIADNLTGLMWTQDGNAPGPVACSPSGTKTWQGALDYVACLNTNSYLGYTDWRLPNVNELQSLVNNGQPNSAAWLNTQGFINAQDDYYWSSITEASYTSSAWVVFFDGGSMGDSSKAGISYVWPVRGGQAGSFAYLTISKSGTGAGSVTVDKGAFIWSGNTGTASYGSAMAVTLTATADSNSTFTGWSGACTGMGECSLTADSDKSAVAAFSFVLDNAPDAFTFTSQSGVALSTSYTSNSITVSGINTGAPISITGGMYSINSGSFTSAAGTVNNGDTVAVRVTSSGSYLATTTATLTIGGVNGTFSVTTNAPSDTTPPTTAASPAGGTYTTAQSVTLTCNDGTGTGCNKIYYTTNGSTPTTNSSSFTGSSGSLPIATTTTIKYFSTDSAGNSGPVQSVTFTINTSSGNPVAVGYSPQWLVMTFASLLLAGGYLLRRRRRT